MFQRIHRFFTSTLRRRLMLMMLVVSFPPLIGAMVYNVYLVRDRLYEYVANEQEHHVHNLVLGVESFLSSVRQDVLFLSQSEEIRDLLEAKADGDAAAYEAARQSLEREFLAFSQVKGVYYQVRYLDAAGMEIARVDSDGSRSFIVPHDQLQDKSSRYYFEDTVVLPQGDVMVSPLDLNIEHGEIETPYKPVIRYATPVWFDGQAAGIVIVNVFAERFLGDLGKERVESEIVALVDQGGYYLYHSGDEAKRWGRDLGTGVTLAQDYPQIVERLFLPTHEIYAHESEMLQDEFLTYTTFSPPGTTAYRWALLSLRPKRVALASVLRLEWAIVGVSLIALLLIVVLGRVGGAPFVRASHLLEEKAINMGRGDLETEISLPPSYWDEIVAMARAFDQARVSLRLARSDLEVQVARAERHARQLHLAAQVSRTVTETLDLQELLLNVAVLISERFGFYHTGLFLLDDTGEWAVLQAASGPGGQRMLARGHRLRVGEQDAVGYVTATGEPRIVLDVGADAAHSVNPDLPDTRSEMALPLQARGQVLGALDVQSTEQGAFTEEDVQTLQTLANQIALAISNVRLFQQTQERAQALQRASGDYSYAAWVEMERSQAGLAYRYSHRTVAPVPDDLWRPEMAQAVQEGDVVTYSADGDDPAGVAIPIRFRDRVIGVIDAHKSKDAKEWTREEVELLETLTDQLSIALESARLYQDTQRRAARERVAGEVTGRIREAVEIDAVLERALAELGQALNAERGTVYLALDAQWEEGV